ncbi:mechanosensitive ion channel domain-containing protein [Desulfococcus sp.]|uniref:mechanosensitive ion channel domain-containing protein n=1 Tax=Desulfococcus sp. TaxID=2025834 RepID=UPI0035945BE0
MKSKGEINWLGSIAGKINRGKRWAAYGLILMLLWACPPVVFSANETENAAKPSDLPLKAPSDSAIEKRIGSVIGTIDDFQNVKIDVREGVVRLSGKTPRMEASENVTKMVSRFEGVVYVDNQIQVETDVEARVKPALDRVRQYLVNAMQKLPIIGVALGVILIFWIISRVATRWELPYKRLGLNRLLRNLIRQLLRKGIFLLGVVLALDILDITALVGALLGTAGVLGFAIGFAFKDIVENYLAGLLLSIRRPFDLNDLVRIESHEGRVIRLTSSELILMTLEGNHVRIPNAAVFKSFISNYSINPRRRFDFGVGVGVNEDLVDVQALGCSALRTTEGVMAEPAPFMLVEELGDYNVLIRFFGWVDQRKADFGKVRSEAIRRIKMALDEARVDMPEPIQTIRLQRGSEARLEPRRPRATGREIQTMDVSPDTQLDDQIHEDLAAAHEPNLLIEA